VARRSEGGSGGERGRPREPSTDKAILEATLRLMSQRGYRGTSMEAVAAEAGVGKPTVYLRFPSKAELATAAISELRLRDLPKDSGDLRKDLIAHLKHLRWVIERSVGMSLIGTLLAEEPEHPELLAGFRERVILARRRQLRNLIEGAIEREELAVTDLQVGAAIDMLVGAYYAHYLAGTTFPRRWAETVVDLVLAALGHPSAAGSASAPTVADALPR
jgi:AcrR family transcriptional regulator